jgi:hypothetical protein
MKYKSMSKSQLADAAGVSRKTFSEWLVPFREDLRRMHVKDTAHVLPPVAVRFICETLEIDLS